MSSSGSEVSAIRALFSAVDSGAKRSQFAPGAAIFEPGDSSSDFYLIESGEVRIYFVGPESVRLLDILGPDNWFGSSALAHLPQHDTRAVAMTHTVVLSIPADRMLGLLRERGDLAIQMMQDMSSRLHQAWNEASLLVSDDCRLRLIKTLVRFSHSSAASLVGEGVILRITHAELAQAVGAARETVSVCLTELRQRNLVRTGRNRLSFVPEDLRQLDEQLEKDRMVSHVKSAPELLPA